MYSYYFLTLAVLLSCFADTKSVSHPGQCRLVFRSDEVQVICVYVNFKRLPSKAFPGNTTDLSVCFSNLSSLTSDDLKILSHLKQLSLIRNQLRTLPADLLLGLSNLHVLDLTGNECVCVFSVYLVMVLKLNPFVCVGATHRDRQSGCALVRASY